MKVLSDWETMQCRFPPTFKVTRDKVTETYNKKRAPSYTDRILFNSMPGFRQNLHISEFTSTPKFVSSDHKPIRGIFEIEPSPTVVPGPLADTQHMRPKLLFTRIAAKDLPVMDGVAEGGKADPYILFYSDPPEVMPVEKELAVG